MKKEVIPLILFLVVVFIPLIVAPPPVDVIQTLEVGLDIAYPKYQYVKVNTSFELHFHVFNSTSGLLVTNETTDCLLHLYQIDGGHAYQDDSSFSSNGLDFENEINSSILNTLGEHAYILQCNSSDAGGFASGSFTVNNNGYGLDEPLSILYVAWIIILFSLFLLSFIVTIKLDGKNSMQGETFTINWKKYLKLFLGVVSYLLLLFLLGGLRSIYYNFLTFDNASQVFNWAYWVLFSLAYPLVILIIIIGFVNFITDKKLYSNWERGLGTR